MLEINLNGTKRTQVGKAATREMRKQGLVPCNIYGEKMEDGKPVAVAFQVEKTDLRKVIYTPNVYVINLNIDGVEHKAIMKELQFHPVSDEVLHIDFLEITEQKPIVIGIPVNLVGLAQGVRDGGRMNLSLRKINVRALYKDIPEKLDIDVTPLRIGKSIKVGDLHFDNIEFATPLDVIVCSIKMTRAANMAAATEGEGESEEAAE